MPTGYRNAFITLAPDCPATVGVVPPRATSIAGLEYALLAAEPYGFTGDELILAVYLRHKEVGKDADLNAVKTALFAKPHPCLRASMLPKRFGWGVHYDGHGRIALYGVETERYRELAGRRDLQVLCAMRNRRAG